MDEFTIMKTVVESSGSVNAGSTTDNDPLNGTGNIVIDELLCFITNKIDVLPTDTIVQLCTATFNEKEIVASKKKLYEHCATELRYKKTPRAKERHSQP